MAPVNGSILTPANVCVFQSKKFYRCKWEQMDVKVKRGQSNLQSGG